MLGHSIFSPRDFLAWANGHACFLDISLLGLMAMPVALRFPCLAMPFSLQISLLGQPSSLKFLCTIIYLCLCFRLAEGSAVLQYTGLHRSSWYGRYLRCVPLR